jgi:hypothetical protein
MGIVFAAKTKGRGVETSVLEQKTEAGSLQIPNQVLKHLFQAGLSGTEWALVLAVIQKTCNRNESVPYISLREFHDLVALDQEAIRKGLKNLRSRNILVQQDPPSFHKPASWRFNADWESWNRVLCQHTPPHQHTESPTPAQGGVLREHTLPYAQGGMEAIENNEDESQQVMKTRSATMFKIINLNTNNNKTDKASSQVGPSAEALSLADQLRNAVRIRDPRAKAARTENVSTWARDIELLIRIDQRTPEEIRRVIDWCQQPDGFWGPNILSGRKLREKFDTLAGQMLRANHRGSNGNTANTSASDETAGSTSERRTRRGDRIYIPRQ